MRCRPKRRGQNAAQEPAALFSPLAGGQGPGMPGSKCGQRDWESVPTGVPYRLALGESGRSRTLQHPALSPLMTSGREVRGLLASHSDVGWVPSPGSQS